jgi:hypothetical protein
MQKARPDPVVFLLEMQKARPDPVVFLSMVASSTMINSSSTGSHSGRPHRAATAISRASSLVIIDG